MNVEQSIGSLLDHVVDNPAGDLPFGIPDLALPDRVQYGAMCLSCCALEKCDLLGCFDVPYERDPLRRVLHLDAREAAPQPLEGRRGQVIQIDADPRLGQAIVFERRGQRLDGVLHELDIRSNVANPAFGARQRRFDRAYHQERIRHSGENGKRLAGPYVLYRRNMNAREICKILGAKANDRVEFGGLQQFAERVESRPNSHL